MAGAFKLDHLQPLKPILVWRFFQLFHLHTGEPFLITPEGQLLEIHPTPELDETDEF